MVKFIHTRCPTCGADFEIPDYLKRPHCIHCRAELIINNDIETYDFNKNQTDELIRSSTEAEVRGDLVLAMNIIDKVIDLEPNNENAVKSKIRIAEKYIPILAQKIASQVIICQSNHSMETFHMRRYGPMISEKERYQFILDKEKLEELKKEGRTHFKMAGLCIICGGIKSCFECEGTGKCFYCQISHNTPLSSCKECDGTGICKWCNGTKLCRGCLGDGLYRNFVFPNDVIKK